VLIHTDPQEASTPVCAWFWPSSAQEQSSRRLALAFPQHAGWGWTHPDATSLLATVTYLDQILARPVVEAPDRLALQVLVEGTKDQGMTQLRSCPVDLTSLQYADDTPVPWQASAQEVHWMRPLTLTEQRQKYLHKYTHGFRFLQAARELPLGIGAPEHDLAGRACDGKRPGVWKVQIERAGSVFDGKRLPGGSDTTWMSTPQIQCCRALGYEVMLQEGYYWPQSQPLLNRWASTLWQAAETLHTSPQRFRHQQARANATQTLRLLTQQSIHLLGQEQAKGGWKRPDWWAQLVGRSRALLFAQLVQLVRKGTMPVLVTPDALWVVSNNLNPLTAVPGLITPARWNGYAVGYDVPLSLSSEVKTIFHSVKEADEVAHILDTLAGEQL
jgi:hypothetical protein